MKQPPLVALETDEAKNSRETVESIARNISALAKSVSALLSGPLNRKALVILLASSSGMSRGTVDDVLMALVNFEKDWLK